MMFLKQEVRNLKSSIEAAKMGEKEITNVDLLRRISQLEKINSKILKEYSPSLPSTTVLLT